VPAEPGQVIFVVAIVAQAGPMTTGAASSAAAASSVVRQWSCGRVECHGGPNTCSITWATVDDADLDPHRLENLRRSIVMLPRARPGLDRDAAIRIIEELQRLQRSDRRYRELVDQLRAVLDAADGPTAHG